MPIDPREREIAANEIMDILQYMGRKADFPTAERDLSGIFKRISEAHGWTYSSEDGRRDECIYLFSSSEDVSHWESSVEIVRLVRHYAVFDRFGRFAIYDTKGRKFGKLIVTSNPNDQIAELEGEEAIYFLDNVRAFRERIKEISEESDRQKARADRLQSVIDKKERLSLSRILRTIFRIDH